MNLQIKFISAARLGEQILQWHTSCVTEKLQTSLNLLCEMTREPTFEKY